MQKIPTEQRSEEITTTTHQKLVPKIGKYASENGNSKAIKHFKAQITNLKESTVGTFKQASEKKLREERKKGNEVAKVLSVLHDTRGRPPALHELDGKLISLVQSIRSRGGVVNFCMVKATTLALVSSNPSSNLSGLEATAPWVRSIYKCSTNHYPPASTTWDF